jgi:hypothetical protein
MAGCHTDGSPCGKYGYLLRMGRNNVNHCDARRPNDANAATVEFGHYPPINYTGEENSQPAVMYDSSLYSVFPPTTSRYSYISPQSSTEYGGANCGKLIDSISCGTVIYENHPSALSFKEMESDTWFYYLYDMGANGSAVGGPCYRIQTEQRFGGISTSITSGGTTTPGGTTDDQEGSTQKCIPCTQFYCTPVSSYCNYTYAGADETGDSDCPYPLIFGIGTQSNKIVVSYDALSEDVPDGCTDFNFVYAADSIDQDVWNETTFSSGNPVVTSQNTWETDERSFSTFIIREIESGSSLGLEVKIGIKPALQDAVDPDDPPVIIGTEWELQEVISQGQNYNINDTFTISYNHTHPSGATTTFTIDLKVTATGTATTVSGVADFSLLTVGDVINGHVVTNTAHSDVDHMPYHVIYIDGNGNDFTKDGAYTSSRNHQVTVVAGYGIKDRAYFGGLYEFFNKSVQYTVHSVEPGTVYTYPGYSNSVIQPEITVDVQNGRVISATVVNGGQNWNTIGESPVLKVTGPPTETGTFAEVAGTFNGGVLQSVTIVNQGSGYNDLDPPSIIVGNYYSSKTNEITGTGTDPDGMGYGDRSDLINNEYFPLDQDAFDAIEAAAAPKNVTFTTTGRAAQFDTSRQRREQTSQVLYSSGAVEEIRPLQSVPDLTGSGVLPQSFDDTLQSSQDTQTDAINSFLDNISDDPEARTFTGPEIYVETTQRRFLDMPKASTYTKYMIKQYRPDSNSKTTFNITIGHNVLESGCGHLEEDPNPLNGGSALCPSPLGYPYSNSSTTTSETSDPDPVTGDTTTTDTTVSYTYTLSPLLGPGCKSWSASGSMTVVHNFTRSRDTFAAATDAYGNPFDV